MYCNEGQRSQFTQPSYGQREIDYFKLTYITQSHFEISVTFLMDLTQFFVQFAFAHIEAALVYREVDGHGFYLFMDLLECLLVHKIVCEVIFRIFILD